MRNMMTDQQYQALVARIGGNSSSLSSHVLLAQSQTQSTQYPRKVYADRTPAAHPYYAGAAPAPPHSQYPPSTRLDRYAETHDIQAQLIAAADRRFVLVNPGATAAAPPPPPAAVLDYGSPPAAATAYVDHVSSRAIAIPPPISPDLAPPSVYPGQYAMSPHHPSQGLVPNAAMVSGCGSSINSSDLLARARLSEVASTYSTAYGNGVRRLGPSSAYEEQALFQGQGIGGAAGTTAGILGPGIARRGVGGQEVDRYMLPMQPDKFIRYGPSSLATPDAGPPALGARSRYSTFGSNTMHPDDDMYSNYRRVKARRIATNDFRGGSPGERIGAAVRRRGRERDQNREPRGVSGAGGARAGTGEGRSNRERDGRGGKESPSRRSKNSSSIAARSARDRPSKGPQAAEVRNEGEGRGGTGGQNNKRRWPSEAVERAAPEQEDQQQQPKEGAEDKKTQQADEKKLEDGNRESDKDSELGSLCADLSDSEDEMVKKKEPEAAATVIDDTLAGMIFGCSTATFHECMRLRLFGLPAKNKNEVMRVAPGTKVFLFNFDTKELSGIFEATSHGGYQIQPDAFREFGGFPAQVRVCCIEQCPNVSQSMFRHCIKENYVNMGRFRFDLSSNQVKDLVRLFRKAARDESRQQLNLADRFFNAGGLPSKDYSGIERHQLAQLLQQQQQQRTFSRHPQVDLLTNREREGAFIYARGPYRTVES